MAEPLLHHFDTPPVLDDDGLRALLGGKGAGLAQMTAAGLPVPPGFTLTTAACLHHLSGGWDERADDEVRAALGRLEEQTGKRLGDPEVPLLVSVRSGAARSMPGMMDTVLDVGMNPTVEVALAGLTGDPAFARDTRCRALRSFAAIVLHAPADVIEPCRDIDVPDDVRDRLATAGFVVPDDPVAQVVAAVRAVFDSWRSPRAQRYREIEGIDHGVGTAATVQAMVFGNLGDRSGTGVAFTRDPATGRPGIMGDFLPGAQGEDVVAGDHATMPLAEMATAWPQQFATLERIGAALEREMRDLVDLEFTVEQGQLWMLQSRRGKRSPIAALRCAVDMAEDPDFPLTREEAVERCRALLDDPPLVRVAEPESAAPIATGLPASPGTASGVLCTDPDDAVERQAAGHAVILARRETSPADIHGMAASVGLFTLLGGLVSHAAVVARDWGLPAVVGAAEATITDTGLEGPGGFVSVGSVVTVDGTTGTLRAGGSSASEHVAPEVETLRRWARSSEASGVRGGDGTTPFVVLHALRIKGMAGADVLATVTGLEEAEIGTALGSLADRGGVNHVATRDLWRLTEDGRAEHAVALARVLDDVDLETVPYEPFLSLNADFKQLCTDWQLRDGDPNDHADAAYDGAVIERLVALDREVRPLLDVIGGVLPWTARYQQRLGAALERVVAGDPKAFTGVLCDSYHDVWMELHEDLIITQGIDRAAEGST